MTLIDDTCDGCGSRFDPMGDPLLTKRPEIGPHAVFCARCQESALLATPAPEAAPLSPAREVSLPPKATQSPAPEAARDYSPIDPAHKSGHYVADPEHPCWCGDIHYYETLPAPDLPTTGQADRDAGLEARYEVTKINDPTGKHTECRYFVLDPQHDPPARKALETYRFEARMAGFYALSNDLRDWLEMIEGDGDE